MSDIDDCRLSSPATADELERLPLGAEMRDCAGFWFVRTADGIASGFDDEWTCEAFAADGILNDGTLRITAMPVERRREPAPVQGGRPQGVGR